MTEPAIIQRDLINIRACRSTAELDGYEAEAMRRGLDRHEVTAIAEQRRAITRKEK